jgi:SAM-dependent methyltransferase
MKNYNKFKQVNNDFFDKLINGSTDEHSAVGQSKASHEKRFKKMLEIGDLDGSKILDVGCGLGAFYSFAASNNIKTDYYGIDINEKMLEGAREKYPQIKDRFSRVDLVEETINDTFDYCISVGPLNLLIDEETNYQMTYKLIDGLFKHARIGCALSMTSSLSRVKDKDTFFFDPKLIIAHVEKFCNNYRLDHSYLPHDFTIFCYKDNFYGKK